MASRHLVDEELVPLLDIFPPLDFTIETLPQFRETQNQMIAAMQGEPDASVVREDLIVPGTKGADARVLVYRPNGAQGVLPAIIYIHGGGFVIGSAVMMDPYARLLAQQLNCVVVSVDYRLAPETPFPGAIEDCYAALKWTHDNATTLSVDPARIAVVGESAGGGLAASLTLLARDRGEVKLAMQILDMPMLDDRTGIQGEPHPFTGEFIWTANHNRLGWRAMIGAEPGGPDVSPYCAPARAKDLSNLPPAFITIGSLDLFLEETLEYARRLIRAGVPVELHVYPGVFHGFQAAAHSRVVQAHVANVLGVLERGLRPKT